MCEVTLKLPEKAVSILLLNSLKVIELQEEIHEMEQSSLYKTEGEDEFRAKIKELEEIVQTYGGWIQDCSALIRQIRPDCDDKSMTIAGRLKKILDSDEEARKDFEERQRLLRTQITKISRKELPLQIYVMLCKKESPRVKVWYKDAGVELFQIGNLSSVQGGILRLINFNITMDNITRIEELGEEAEDEQDM